jgi:hypothetical protein
METPEERRAYVDRYGSSPAKPSPGPLATNVEVFNDDGSRETVRCRKSIDPTTGIETFHPTQSDDARVFIRRPHGGLGVIPAPSNDNTERG